MSDSGVFTPVESEEIDLGIVTETVLKAGKVAEKDIVPLTVNKNILILELINEIQSALQDIGRVLPTPRLLFLRGHGKIADIHAPLSKYTKKKQIGSIFVLQDVLSFHKVYVSRVEENHAMYYYTFILFPLACSPEQL